MTDENDTCLPAGVTKLNAEPVSWWRGVYDPSASYDLGDHVYKTHRRKRHGLKALIARLLFIKHWGWEETGLFYALLPTPVGDIRQHD